MASDNKTIGRFHLADIPPSPRGVPQIEVTFDIDANGILNVSAKDKATGKAQSIVIKASSGLSDDEVQNMIKDAESHVEEDKKFKEMIELRNQADSLIHNSEKTMTDLGDGIAEDEKKEIEAAVNALKDALKSEEKAQIEEKMKVLSDMSGKLAEKLYAKNNAESAATGEQDSSTAQDSTESKNQEGVVDAEFEEVKEDKK